MENSLLHVHGNNGYVKMPLCYIYSAFLVVWCACLPVIIWAFIAML